MLMFPSVVYRHYLEVESGVAAGLSRLCDEIEPLHLWFGGICLVVASASIPVYR